VSDYRHKLITGVADAGKKVSANCLSIQFILTCTMKTEKKHLEIYKRWHERSVVGGYGKKNAKIRAAQLFFDVTYFLV
jgi:hypothetical protein